MGRLLLRLLLSIALASSGCESGFERQATLEPAPAFTPAPAVNPPLSLQALRMEYSYSNEDLSWSVTLERPLRSSGVLWNLWDKRAQRHLYSWMPVQTEVNGDQFTVRRAVILKALLPSLPFMRLDLSLSGTENVDASIDISELCGKRPQEVFDKTRPRTPLSPLSSICRVRYEELPARAGDPGDGTAHRLQAYRTRPGAASACAFFRTRPEPDCRDARLETLAPELARWAEGPIALDLDDHYPGVLVGNYGATLYNLARPLGTKFPVLVFSGTEIRVSAALADGTPLVPGDTLCAPSAYLSIEGTLSSNGVDSTLAARITHRLELARECAGVFEDAGSCLAAPASCAPEMLRMLRARFSPFIDAGVLSPQLLPLVHSLEIRALFD